MTESLQNESRWYWKIPPPVAALVVIVVDQLTKWWALSALQYRDIEVFWTLRFNLIYNKGSAFGVGSSFSRWWAVLVIGVVIAVLFMYRSIKDPKMRLVLAVLLGGAIGNVIDRVFRAESGFLSGAVIDFIDFQWWPVFNVADMAVVCASLGLALQALFIDQTVEAAGRESNDTETPASKEAQEDQQTQSPASAATTSQTLTPSEKAVAANAQKSENKTSQATAIDKENV